MKIVLFITILMHDRFHVQSLNVDTKFPIIYSKPNITDRNSYFGFSLLLHKNWIQIGAPRANSTILGEEVMEPGVAYRCRINEPCEEVELDKKKNLCPKYELICPLKNYAWIGGAMAMEYGKDGKVVICGHRWKNQADLSPKNSEVIFNGYAMTGICYISLFSEPKLNFKPTLPKETYEKSGKIYGDYGLFHNSQIGMSVYIAQPSQKNISLLIGAPGAGRNWSGGIVEYAREKRNHVEARRKREVNTTDFGGYVKRGFTSEFVFCKSYIKQFSYFGYQVAAGYFFSKDELFRVAGSPRGAELKGLVAIYNVWYVAQDLDIINCSMLEGESFGDYFGSSLAVADVTGDTFDDLIVGAPLYSEHGDEGCIYLYTKDTSIRNKNQYYLYQKEKKIGLQIGGRFGTAISSLGDIDQDGCEDIAVGAPYEDSGVIYIFNGVSSRGLSLRPSQRIRASDIHKSIRGFGISISRPADIDDNKFEDVAVGSYLSEHVVLLRSYPVVELFSRIESQVKQFNMTSTNFIVNACLFYNGSDNVPKDIEVVRTIDVDTKFRRFKPIAARHLVLSKINQFNCENITVNKKEESDDSIYDFSDITIVISQSLKNQENNLSSVLWVNNASRVNGADKFCRYCPIVKKVHPFVINIPYTRECGEDHVCKSDAQIDCILIQNDTILNTTSGFVIGSSSTLKLAVSVLNHGDPLYSPKVIINIPEEIDLAQIPLTCQDFEGSPLSIACIYGRINNEERKSVNISLDFSAFEILRSMSEDELPLTITVSISKDNYNDPDERNNHCNMTLNLIMEADVNITGKSEGEVFFSKNDRKELNFIHVYEVSNVGVSPIRRVETWFNIPVEWDKSGISVQFANPSVKAQQNQKSIFCNVVDSHLKSDQNGYQKNYLLDVNKTNGSITLSDNHPSNRTLYLNCSSSNVKCQTWKCSFIEFKANTFTKIVITPKVNTSKLAHIMGNRDIIFFSSHAYVEMVEANGSRSPGIETFHDITVSSAAIGTLSKERIELWIIILCIIVGILMIAAIVIGLAKAGFFKREKKEELQALKQTEK